MRILPLLFVLAACNGEDEVVDTGEGLLGHHLLDVYPNPMLVDAEGHLAIPSAALPIPSEGTALPVERFAGWRTGFSAGQVTVFELDAVNAAALPSWRAPTPGEGGVLLVDLDTGSFLPVMAELDAHPDAADNPSLLVRPLVALPDGHRVAVVVTTAVTARPERFDRLLGDTPPASLADYAEHFRGLVDDLVGLGLAADDIAVATDFPVALGREPLEQVLAEAPLPTTFVLDEVREGDDLPPRSFRAAEGTFTAPTWVGDDGFLAMDPATGTLTATGTRDYPLYVHVPASVADAPAGSVPVLLFGHGLFASPEGYLDDPTDSSAVLALLDDMGAIGIATHWEGLASDQRVDAIGAAVDFGRLPIVPDRVVQSNGAVRSLQRLIREGDLFDDAVFQGSQGQLLADPDHFVYYGISLGGIEGAVQVASGAPFDAAVLHVGGGMWTTMLERSTQWPVFEVVLTDHVPDPAERQLLYAVSQLFWDPVDPVAWVGDGMGDVPTLWQESLGDEQVANLTTRVLARTAGAPLLQPPVESVWGLDPLNGPADDVPLALAQFDAEVGVPADVNRPPEASGAHSIPRTFATTARQTATFLAADTLGRVVHPCGDAPCTASNAQVEEP